MAKIKFATEADGTTKFYPINITDAVVDITRNQRLSATITDLYNRVAPTYATNAECEAAAEELT